MERYRLREEIREDMLRTLRLAASQRKGRKDLVDGEPGWVRYERQTMYEPVVRWRRKLALPSVSLVEVERVERQAEGHIDYASKWALYCAELALGITPREVQV